jgi:hypothetical protein
MARPDSFLTLFKDIGFLPMRMPRADVKPLNMVEQDGKDLNLLGELTNAMISPPTVTAPPVISDIQAAQEVQGQKSSNVKFSIGITILGNILKAITAQDFGITAAFHNTATVTFEFADVKVDKVDIILLDQFLNQSDINERFRNVPELGPLTH